MSAFVELGEILEVGGSPSVRAGTDRETNQEDASGPPRNQRRSLLSREAEERRPDGTVHAKRWGRLDDRRGGIAHYRSYQVGSPDPESACGQMSAHWSPCPSSSSHGHLAVPREEVALCRTATCSAVIASAGDSVSVRRLGASAWSLRSIGGLRPARVGRASIPTTRSASCSVGRRRSWVKGPEDESESACRTPISDAHRLGSSNDRP